MSKTNFLRISLLVVIVAGIGAIILGMKVKSARQEAEKSRVEAEQKATELSTKLVTAETTAKRADEELKSTQTSLQSVQQEAEASKKAAQENMTKLQQTESELAKVAADAKAASSKLDALQSVLPQGVAPEQIVEEMKKVRENLDNLNQEKQILSTKLADMEKENSSMKKRLENRVSGQIPKDLVGHVIAVNPEWNFVVLDVGENDGVVANQAMLLYRDGQLVGRIKITSIEPSIAIGDIVPKWPHGDVREGDSAIAAETNSN